MIAARAILTAVVAAAGLVAGCGSDDDEPALPEGPLAILDWERAQPERACETEQAARARAGRQTLLARTAQAPASCWLAVDARRPLAGRDAITSAERSDDGRILIRFTPKVRDQLSALGPDSHVGLVIGDRLLAVAHPAGGELSFVSRR